MKVKIITFYIIFFLAFSLLISGCTSVNTNNTIENDSKQSGSLVPKPKDGQLFFRLADNWGEDYPSVLGDKEFARLVKKRSMGKIKILVYANATLGDEKSVIEQVQLGGIDFARVNSAPLSSANSKINVLSLPYLFRDSNHLWDVLLGPIGDELLSSLKDGNITGLAYYDSGARSFYTKVPIASIADLNGLKIRVQQNETFESFIKLLGAVPVPLAFGDVYNSLQKNEIDGAENNWPSYLFTNHYKIAHYYIMDEHTRNPEILIANNKLMNNLSKEYQQIIFSSAKDSLIFQRKAWAETEKKSEDSIRNSGTIIIKLTTEEKALLEKKVAPLYNKFGKDYQSLIERIRNTK